MFVGLNNSEQFGPFYTYLLSLLLCIIPLFAETALGFVFPVGVMEHSDKWNFKENDCGKETCPCTPLFARPAAHGPWRQHHSSKYKSSFKLERSLFT